MTLKVEVDWDRDGDYVDAGEDVTTRIRRNESASVRYGRDQSTALAPTISANGNFTLDNISRDYSPRNPASPLYGKIKPARPVRITREIGGLVIPFTIGAGAVIQSSGFYTLFIGHTDDSPINPDVDNKTVSLSLVDSLADFRGQTISTSVYDGLRTGEAIGIILDQCGWIGDRDLDDGATVMPWWWEDGTDALDALEKLVRCEGPPALLTIGTDGAIVFRDRHHRLLDTSSITSQDTWRNTGTVQPVMNRPFVYDEAWRNIINTGIISVDVRVPHEIEALWTVESQIGLGPFETQTIIASSSDHFINAIIPVVGTDYTLLSGSVVPGLSRTSGSSTTITLTAGGSGAVLSGLQLRAYPIRTAYTVQVTASDPTSIIDYGSRSFPGDLPFCNTHDAQAVLNTAVELRSQPLPVVNVRFMIGVDEDRVNAVLPRDLSDRVTIVESETVLNDDFYIESFAHQFHSEYDHEMVIGLEAVPPDQTVTASNIFIIGSNVSGHRIGTGLLAA